MGHEVKVACDGPAGIAAAHDFHPEFVLCDIGLPGMSGHAVARALRADAALKTAYLVALTGYALPDDIQRATESGFHRHLAKPPSFEPWRSCSPHANRKRDHLRRLGVACANRDSDGAAAHPDPRPASPRRLGAFLPGLVGSFGLVAVAPFTALVGGLVYRWRPSESSFTWWFADPMAELQPLHAPGFRGIAA